MEYFLVMYDSRVVIYKRKMFIRLATGLAQSLQICCDLFESMEPFWMCLSQSLCVYPDPIVSIDKFSEFIQLYLYILISMRALRYFDEIITISVYIMISLSYYNIYRFIMIFFILCLCTYPRRGSWGPRWRARRGNSLWPCASTCSWRWPGRPRCCRWRQWWRCRHRGTSAE